MFWSGFKLWKSPLKQQIDSYVRLFIYAKILDINSRHAISFFAFQIEVLVIAIIINNITQSRFR